MPVSIEDMEGIENFAALIIRKDNPSILDIVSEFSNTVAMLRVKPDCLNRMNNGRQTTNMMINKAKLQKVTQR